MSHAGKIVGEPRRSLMDPHVNHPPSQPTPLFREHPRSFETNRFVYPVVSRRSGGVSIGVNLNPDKVCNFDCIYCQVDRVSTSETRFVGPEQLLAELDHMLELVTSGELFDIRAFAIRRPTCGG